MDLAAGRAALLALGLAAGGAVGLEWSAVATIEPPTVAAGERCTYCVTVTAPRLPGGQAPRFEVEPPALGVGLRLTSARFQSLRWVDGDYQYSCCWTLTAATPGDIAIAPTPVRRRLPGGGLETRQAPGLTVQVTAGAALAPVEPPPVGRSLAPWLVGGLTLAVVLSTAGALRWLRPDTAAPAAGSPAGRALAALTAAEDLLDGDREAFYAAVAAALYGYVAELTGAPGAGLTTTEAAARLAAVDVAPALRDIVLETLRAADEVRFARAPAPAAAARARSRRLRAALETVGKDR